MQFDLFTPKAPPLFGLDISSSSVKMLEIVEAGKGTYRVERYAIEPLARDAVVDGNINNLEAVTDAVRRAHKRLGTRTKHVAMAVPTGAVITKKIVVPASLREEELEVQVESEGNQLTQEIVTRYGMSAEEAENAKRSGGLPDDFEAEVLRPFMENLSGEIQRALQFFFASTQYHTVEHILLAGGSAVIPGLDEVVNTRAQVPTSVAYPFAP